LCPLIARAEQARTVFDYSLEELMNIEVVSVAKSKQKLSKAAASIFVLNQEDIRRSGANSIPELLRLVPGVQVARIDASKWAVSIRGFNSRFASKLLVMIDGRSIYNQQFSGVRWEQHNVPLQDIERIEVIRGPGGSLWGANAVNGVINIITKQASETQGGLLLAGTGSHEQNGMLRYGGNINDRGHYRVYTKYQASDPFDTAAGNDAYDEWDVLQGGFRADWASSAKDKFTLVGDSYSGKTRQSVITTSLTPPGNSIVQDDVDIEGTNLVFNWRHQSSKSSQWLLKTYVDQVQRNEVILINEEITYEIDLQHDFQIGKLHHITWGAGYRRVDDENINSFTVSLAPTNRSTDLYSLFIQDEYRLANDMQLTIGSKFEHNDFTGYEVQPSARLLWDFDEYQTFWGSLSRDVSTPSRALSDARINVTATAGPVLVSNIGNNNLESEEVISLEFGYRLQFEKKLTLDSVLFYNRYDNLVSQEANAVIFETNPSPPHTLISTTYGNKLQGDGYGVEFDIRWQVTRDWRLLFGYSILRLALELDADSTDTISVNTIEGRSPRQQAQLRSSIQLFSDWEFDVAVYYVDELSSLNVDAYTRVDLRLGRQLYKNLDVSLVVQNLQDKRHAEFVPVDLRNSEVPRMLYGQLIWQF